MSNRTDVCLRTRETSHWSVLYTVCDVADEETDMDVHDRALLYYRLLKHGVSHVGFGISIYRRELQTIGWSFLGSASSCRSERSGHFIC